MKLVYKQSERKKKKSKKKDHTQPCSFPQSASVTREVVCHPTGVATEQQDPLRCSLSTAALQTVAVWLLQAQPLFYNLCQQLYPVSAPRTPPTRAPVFAQTQCKLLLDWHIPSPFFQWRLKRTSSLKSATAGWYVYVNTEAHKINRVRVKQRNYLGM